MTVSPSASLEVTVVTVVWFSAALADDEEVIEGAVLEGVEGFTVMKTSSTMTPPAPSETLTLKVSDVVLPPSC